MKVEKIVKISFENMNFSLVVDSDGDNEPAVSLQVKIPEVISEVISLLTKKPEAV